MEQKRVYCQLWENGKSDGLECWQSNVYPTFLERDGRACRRLIVNQADKRIYCRILQPISNDCIAAVKVTFYDEGTGHFALLYKEKGKEKYSEPVLLADTKTWKEHTFYLRNAEFDKSISANDFCIDLNPRLYGCSADHVIFGSAEVAFIKQAPVKIDITSKGLSGNTFFDKEDISLNAEITNTSSEQKEVRLMFTVYEDEGDVVWTEQKRVLIQPNGSQVCRVTPKIEKYGLYVLKTECLCDDEYEINKTRFAYSLKAPLNERLGGCVHFLERDSAVVAPLMKECGMGYIRDGFDWNLYEKEKNNFVFIPAWERYLSDTLNSGMGMMTVLGMNNPLYHEGSICVPKTQEELDGFERYVYTLVSYLGERCSIYEVWNEPNLQSFSYDMSPESYITVLKVAHRAIKRANPKAYITGPGTTGEAFPWIEKFLQLGGGEYLDAVSIHPYIWTVGPVKGGLYEKIRGTERLIEKYCPKLEIIISEMGWSVQTGGTTRKSHAEKFVQALAVTMSFKRLNKYYLYEFQDSGIKVSDVERNFGLVEYWEAQTPYAAKPIYTATATYNTLIGDSVAEWFVGENNPDGISAYCFEKQDRYILMLWSDNKEYNLEMPAQYDNAVIYDINGNEIQRDNAMITTSPLYISTSFRPDESVLKCMTERSCD